MLLLDEPTAGMNPQESAQFNEFVYRVRDDKGISVLLIEHDMSVIMKISERITVLDRGSMIAEGTPDDIRNNQTVIEAYLGKTGTREGRRTEMTLRNRRGREARRAWRRSRQDPRAGQSECQLRQHRCRQESLAHRVRG